MKIPFIDRLNVGLKNVSDVFLFLQAYLSSIERVGIIQP